MFLRRFDPNTIDPLFLVNRKNDFDWILDALTSYLTDPDAAARQSLALAVVGEKGVGKTILTRAALRKAREEFSDRAIFLEVDCRKHRSARQVIDAIAKVTVTALDEMKNDGENVSDELLATAKILGTITRFDEAELKGIHQHVEQYKAACKLQGSRSLLKALSTHFEISVERSASTSRELLGKVRFDEQRLCDAVCALFSDIRASGIDVVLYLDNMDELRHNFRTDEERQKTRTDAEALLLLRDAPIVLVVNMRTYFSGILTREISHRCKLNRLQPTDLAEILRKRIEHERPDVKAKLADPIVGEALAKLADIAPTPLAFLKWFQTLFAQDALSADKLAAGVDGFLDRFYTSLPVSAVRQIVATFPTVDTAMTREALIAGCSGNAAIFNQAVDYQVILPKDFWDPGTYYTLDPELHFAHPSCLPAAAR